jgi:dTDP-4-dehydrorhamnose reductase
MDFKKVLITGGSGTLGRELIKVFPGSYAPSHEEMDVTDLEQVIEVVDHIDPDLIIHAAAMTDVRKCDDQWQIADAINIGGTYNVAIAADGMDAKLIHISTACVFDGENAPFNESSKPFPKNHYALTKYVAEQVVQQVSEDYLIIRTNFVARERWKYPAAFTDRFGSYLYADDVAYAIKKIKRMNGLVHVCGDKKMSMYELAKRTSPEVKEMTMADYWGPQLTRDMTLESKVIPHFKLGEYRYEGDV